MIYIVSGEPYQASQFVKKLKEQKIKEGFEYYFFDVEDAGEEIGKTILGLLGTLSLFGRKKFIVLHDYEFTFGKYFLEKFFEKVGTNDILFSTAVKKRMSVPQQREVSISHFEIPKGESLKAFIVKEFRARGVKSDYQMTQLFMHNLYQLSSLYPIVNEIEKISLAPTYGKDLLTVESNLTPFSLTDALVKKDIPDALRILEKQFQQGEKPFDILNRIIWQLRVLLIVQSYKLEAISYKLGIHPFVIKKAREALRFFPPQELKNLYLKAISLYGEILFSSLPSDLLVSRFFWQI